MRIYWQTSGRGIEYPIRPPPPYGSVVSDYQFIYLKVAINIALSLIHPRAFKKALINPEQFFRANAGVDLR